MTKKKEAAPHAVPALADSNNVPVTQAHDAWRKDRIPVAQVARRVARANTSVTTDEFVQSVEWLLAMQTIERDPDLRVIDEHSGQIVAGTALQPKHPDRYSMTRDEADRFMRRHGFTDATLQPFVMPLYPSEVPARLGELPPDAVVFFDTGTRCGRVFEGHMTAGDVADEYRETIKRQSEGWLTLEEAAQTLQEAGCGSASDWIDKLKSAAREHTLPMQAPSTLGRVQYHDRPARARFEWTHVDDLNCWLEEHEPHLPFRFGEQAPAEPTTVAGAVQGVPTTRTHRIADNRGDALRPHIEYALRTAGPNASAPLAWAEFEKLARNNPPAPIKGVTSGGVQYHAGGQVKVLTSRAFADRIRRMKGDARLAAPSRDKPR
jgi:hypothetical protein